MSRIVERIREYHIAVRIILALLLTGIILLAVGDRFTRNKVLNYNDNKSVSEYIELSKHQAKQYFAIDTPIKSIDVFVKNKEEAILETVQLELSLYDAETDMLLAKAESTLPGILDETIAQFALAEPVDFTMNENEKKQVYFMLREKNQLPVLLSVTKGDYREKLLMDDKPLSFRSRFHIYEGVVSYPWMLLLFGVLLFIVILLMLMQLEKVSQRIRVEYLFLLLAATAGIGFAVINPPSQESDGWEHLLRSVDVSYGNLLDPFLNLTHEDGIIHVSKNINAYQFQVVEANTQAGNHYLENLRNTKFSKEKREMKYESSFVSLFYLPQACGLWIGRGLSLSMYGAVILARIFNLAAYIMLSFFALRLLPCYKNLLLLITLLPISLYQAASCSPDALLHGLSFLFLAYCLHLAFAEEGQKKLYHGLLLGALLAVLFLCKYIYLCMGLLVLLIPQKRFGTKKEYWRSFLLAMLPLILVLGFMLPGLLGSVGQTAANQQAEMTQLQYIVSNPLSFVKMLARTFIYKFGNYTEMLSTLGWLTYSLTPLTVLLPCILTGVGMLDTNAVAKQLNIKQRLLLLLTFGICTVALMTGLYLGDGRINPVGSNEILGVQGRYFIPIMALPFIALGSRKITQTIRFFTMKTAVIIGIALLFSEFALLNYCY